jgi:hypothetical protein
MMAAFPPGGRGQETLIRLTVQPMPAPKPALKYRLLPELREMNPGNPIQGYLRSFMEQQTFFFDKESVSRRERLSAMPLPELAKQGVQDYSGSALRQVDWAARLDNPDWQILLKLKSDGFNTLLPDVQQLRSLANALKVRFRAEVAQRRFDDALVTAKTMFAIAHHLGEHPTIIGDLVGIAIAAVAIGPLEEMLEQPGCPNLYWALTNLPNPLVSFEKGWEGERVNVLPLLRDLDDRAPMSEDQLKKLIAFFDKVLKEEFVIRDRSVRAWVEARAKDEALIRAARRRLVEVGLPEERLLSFPAGQVVLLDAKREYEVRRDELMKLMNLPAWQVEALVPKAKASKESDLFDFVLPAVDKVRRAQSRLEQRIALLRHVEALRLYAAAHDGKLPEKLADVGVPLPDDPFTGKPFRYNAEGATAHVRGSPPPGLEKEPVYNVHYEVTIQKVRDEGAIQK